jgi:hypothetical protein
VQYKGWGRHLWGMDGSCACCSQCNCLVVVRGCYVVCNVFFAVMCLFCCLWEAVRTA